MKFKTILIVAWISLIALGANTFVLAEAKPGQRVLVEFSDSTLDPENPGFIEGLSEAIGYPLVYVGPLRGSNHILQVARPLSSTQVERLVKRLSTHPSIRHAQKDSVARIAPERGGMSHAK